MRKLAKGRECLGVQGSFDCVCRALCALQTTLRMTGLDELTG